MTTRLITRMTGKLYGFPSAVGTWVDPRPITGKNRNSLLSN